MTKALELPKPSTPGVKVCYRCRKEKALSEFCKDKSRVDGLNPYCKECEKEKREPCEICGKEPAQAHHDDYNYPLKVRWLCQDCHAKWHRDNKPIRKRKENI